MPAIPQTDIDRAMAVGLAEIADERGLNLKKFGQELVGPCPRCIGTDRFSINTAKQVFNCRGCNGRGRGAIAFVMWLDDCEFREAVETLIGQRSVPVKSVKLVDLPAKKSDDESARKIESARRIWRNSVDPPGTLAEKYLNGRGLDLPDDLCGRVLRFHPACPWDRGEVPALIAAFHPIIEPDDRAPPTAILRIGLNADGTKIAKMMLGPVAGCGIKLDADENVSHGLGIAEGLETALKVRATGWRPIWALGSEGSIRRFPPLAGIEALTVFADHDGAGLNAAQICAERWQAAGAEVFVRWPKVLGLDYADVTP